MKMPKLFSIFKKDRIKYDQLKIAKFPSYHDSISQKSLRKVTHISAQKFSKIKSSKHNHSRSRHNINIITDYKHEVII